MECQLSGIGLRLVPRHLIGMPTQLRKYDAAQLASNARNSKIASGGFSSSRVNAAYADFIARSHFSERRIDFSRVSTLASIFCAISDRQNSFLFAGFSRLSNCQRTRCGLAEYPDAPAMQTMSPFQLIRIRLTFCSASHDRTSNETLPLPSRRMMRSGSEPLRVDRRLFRLSHAAMAGSFSMA
jgi:hypothetical protein